MIYLDQNHLFQNQIDSQFQNDVFLIRLLIQLKLFFYYPFFDFILNAYRFAFSDKSLNPRERLQRTENVPVANTKLPNAGHRQYSDLQPRLQ